METHSVIKAVSFGMGGSANYGHTRQFYSSIILPLLGKQVVMFHFLGNCQKLLLLLEPSAITNEYEEVIGV